MLKIYTGKCPGCGAQMPMPSDDEFDRRYHTCPSCKPRKKWRVVRIKDVDGNLHLTYSDTRPSAGGLTEVVRFRCTPEQALQIKERGGSVWARDVLLKILDN